MIGIDKIALHTRDFKPLDLTDASLWGVNANRKQGSIGELPTWKDSKGHEIKANGFHHNTDLFNLTIDYKGCNISFNPSKIKHEYNLLSTGVEFKETISTIETEINKICSLDFKNMSLCRFDLARNESMDFPISMYFGGLRLLKGKRSESRNEPEGFYIGNRTHQSIFYNKETGLKYSLGNSNFITPPNFMRGECRYLKSLSVKRYANGIRNINDLFELSPSDLDLSYKNYFNKVIFVRSKLGLQLKIDWNDEIELFKALKKDKPKGYFSYWLQLNSINNLMDQFGSMQSVKDFISSDELGESTSARYRNLQKLEQLIALRGQLDKQRNVVNDASLLQEIKQRFVA
jgi:hypothetical protein